VLVKGKCRSTTYEIDDAARASGRPQRTTDLPDRPTISAPARSGSPAPFALFIEPVLLYEQHKDPLEKLISDERLSHLSESGCEAFIELASSGLFEGEPADGAIKRKSTYNPYIHQVEMLFRGADRGKPGIVTSGTGSGKTESFMLPILATLANEGVKWPAPQARFLQEKWWAGGDAFVHMRHNESPKRPKALRAIILCPMNALVDDQMVRLRRTLDSDEAHAVMDERFSGRGATKTTTSPVRKVG
jgi:hypothetical protein